MKKSIVVFCIALVTLSLTAFSLLNKNNTAVNQDEVATYESSDFVNDLMSSIYKPAPEFFYNVGTRFREIKKEDLDKATSFYDFDPKLSCKSKMPYTSVEVIILDDSKQTDIREAGNSEMLNAAQINLLQSMDYSTNILLRAGYQEKNMEKDELKYSYYSTPHLTIVPEKQAAYVNGKDALLEYLKENSKEQTVIVQEDKLKSGKLYFTVTKDGTISNVKVVATSGYVSVDETMIDLISKVPGKWEPAENSKGEKVDQKLVFSFGLMGC